MKVKIIKDFRINKSYVKKGEELKVRLLRDSMFDLNPRVQVIEGEHSGEIIPKEIFIEIPEEKTYTEKEWNDMENYYMDELDDGRKKINELILEKKRLENEVDEARDLCEVELPLEVYEAFTRLERGWRKHLDRQTMDLMLLTIMGIHAVGDALILKEFALKNATTYLKAIMNGYTLSDKEREKEEIRRWYKGALVRMEDKTDPDGFAKEAIEEVALYLGGAEILADLSPFCKNQLSKKKAN